MFIMDDNSIAFKIDEDEGFGRERPFIWRAERITNETISAEVIVSDL